MQVTFEANTAKNLYAQIAEFLEAAIADGSPSAGQVAREAKQQITESAPEPAAEKPKRKRRTKAQIEADKKKAEEAKQAAQEPAQTASDPFGEDAVGALEVTYEQMRNAAKKVHEKHGLKVTHLLLARYHTNKVIEVEQKYWADLYKRCNDEAEIAALVAQAAEQ